MNNNWRLLLLIVVSWLIPVKTIACIPLPSPLGEVRKDSMQLVYLQVNNTKFAIPENYGILPIAAKVAKFDVSLPKPQNTNETTTQTPSPWIYVTTRPGVDLPPLALQNGTMFQDGITIYALDMNIEAAKKLLNRFVVTKNPPADWDETIALFPALLLDSLEYWDPNGCLMWNLAGSHKSIESERAPLPVPTMDIIDRALSNKNYNLRASAIRWLKANPWHQQAEADKRLATVESADPIPYLRQAAKEARSQLKP